MNDITAKESDLEIKARVRKIIPLQLSIRQTAFFFMSFEVRVLNTQILLGYSSSIIPGSSKPAAILTKIIPIAFKWDSHKCLVIYVCSVDAEQKNIFYINLE